MTPRARFIKFYRSLPEGAQTGMVYNYPSRPMTLRVCFIEVKARTKVGKRILEDLGFEGKA